VHWVFSFYTIIASIEGLKCYGHKTFSVQRRRGNQIRDVCPKPGRTTSTRPELIRVTSISTPKAYYACTEVAAVAATAIEAMVVV